MPRNNYANFFAETQRQAAAVTAAEQRAAVAEQRAAAAEAQTQAAAERIRVLEAEIANLRPAAGPSQPPQVASGSADRTERMRAITIDSFEYLSLPHTYFSNTPYFTCQPIGTGGFGNVYKVSISPSFAHLGPLKVKGETYREFAWKAFKPEHYFLHEASHRKEVVAMCSVTHSSLVPCLGWTTDLLPSVQEDSGEFVLAQPMTGILMPYYAGGAISSVIKEWENTNDNLPYLIGAIRVLFEGLEALHAAEIVHRDVKPENILSPVKHAEVDLSPYTLDEGKQCRLGDYGLARPQEQGGVLQTLNLISGTPSYMAPEYAMCMKTPSNLFSYDLCRADMYSAGVTAHELVAGKRVTDIPDMTAARQHMANLREQTVQYPGLTSSTAVRFKYHRKYPETTSALSTLFENLWDYDPSLRLTAAQAKADLDQIIERELQADFERLTT